MTQSIFTFHNLYNAYLECRANKRGTSNALAFEWDLENNLCTLQAELADGSYCPGQSICFGLLEPSPREIFAATFRDRVVHHVLVRELHEAGERSFIFDSFSCRPGKGTHAAVDRLQDLVRKASANNTRELYYAQLDIAGFFMSIDHDVLYSLVERLVDKQDKPAWWKHDVLWLAKIIVYHKPTRSYRVSGDPDVLAKIPPCKSLFWAGEKKGLPIGNYSSQFFANLYLNELDQFVKRRLRCRYYVRYVDDFVLLDADVSRLRRWEEEINTFVHDRLKVELCSDKSTYDSVERGIDFLGYVIKPDHRLVRQAVVRRMYNKVYADRRNKREEDDVNEAVINSYIGHCSHADSNRLQRRIHELCDIHYT